MITKLMKFLCLALLIGVPIAVSPALAQQSAGYVERIKGSASRTAGEGAAGISETLAQGGAIYSGDVIKTDAGARLRVRFDDQSSLTIGENAEIVVDEFVYDNRGTSSQALNVLKGVFRYTSGQISKISPTSVAFSTPVATIGIRGTRFIGGELTVGMPPGQAHYGFQLSEGVIEVASPEGAVVLDEPGEGTFLPLTRVAAPTPVRQWSYEATAEAEAALAF